MKLSVMTEVRMGLGVACGKDEADVQCVQADDIYREDITFRDPRNAFTGKRCVIS